MTIIAKSPNQSCRYDATTAWKVPTSSAYYIRDLLNMYNEFVEVDESGVPIHWEVFTVYEGQDGYTWGSTRHMRLYKGELVRKYDSPKKR